MDPALVALLHARHGVDIEGWHSFWNRLSAGTLERGETVALLASLATKLPENDTLAALVQSLRDRHASPGPPLADAVNIVGTGGGPSTFNVSTAAAFVAAAMGVRVVKTGSRAHFSTCGSIDLLEMLGVPLTKSYEQTASALERTGIAFAGYFVYPKELTLLAKSILPLGMQPFGRFLNAVGPFLANLPVSAQVTGVSSPSLLPSLRHLASACRDRRVWLFANDRGADELLPFAENTLYLDDGEERPLRPSAFMTVEPGDVDALRPAAERAAVIAHFLDVLAGKGSALATQTVCLNAAALAVAGGRSPDFRAAVDAAHEAVRAGAALEVVQRVRASAPSAGRSKAVSAHG